MRAKHFFCTAVAVALAAQFAQARVIEIHTFNGPSRKPVAVEGVTLSVADTALSVDSTLTLTPSLLPANATNKNVEWESSNTDVATVNSSGEVVALTAGVTTITVTTKDGSKTATCTVTVFSLSIGSIVWAPVNVDDSGKFAARPDIHTKFYQWNRPTAWSAEGSVVGWDETHDDALSWSFNPCPTGWRLPTNEEFLALNSISTWVDVGERLNVVAGRFYGTRHADCTLADMKGCIFLPAGGERGAGGGLSNISEKGNFWCSTRQSNSVSGSYLSFDKDDSDTMYNISASLTANAYSIRCVRDIP